MGTFLCVSQFVSEIITVLKRLTTTSRCIELCLFRSVLPHLVAKGGDLGLGYDSIAFSAMSHRFHHVTIFYHILILEDLRRSYFPEVFSIFPAVSLRSTQKKKPWKTPMSENQWEFQNPKMEVLYHIRPYFVGIFPEIKALYRPYMYGTSDLGS